jgi:hypothetical protein
MDVSTNQTTVYSTATAKTQTIIQTSQQLINISMIDDEKYDNEPVAVDTITPSFKFLIYYPIMVATVLCIIFICLTLRFRRKRSHDVIFHPNIGSIHDPLPSTEFIPVAQVIEDSEPAKV